MLKLKPEKLCNANFEVIADTYIDEYAQLHNKLWKGNLKLCNVYVLS